MSKDKKIKIQFKNFIHSNEFVITMFIILSILSGLILFKANYVGGASDIHFHLQRIYDLRSSIINKKFFPKFAINQFNQNGNAVMTMYSYINLFPIVLLSFVIKQFIPLLYSMFILRTLASLIISYYSCLHFDKDKKVSFLFSISYSLSTMVLSYSFQSMDMGVTSSLLFLPLVLFGFFELIKSNRWLELSIGISLIIFSHILSTAIITILILTLCIINYSSFNYKKVFSLIKAIILTMLTTGIFWVPFIYLNLTNKISLPPMYFQLGGTDFNTLINAIFSNQISTYINIIAVVGLILGIINYKYLNIYTKQCFWISTVFIFICSDLFPWIILNDTFIKNTLQFSWRLYIIPQLMLCYVFAKALINLCYTNKQKKIFILLSTLLIVNLQFTGQKSIINQSINWPEITKPFSLNNFGTSFKITNQNEFNNIISNYQVLDKDYYPTKALVDYNDIVNHQSIYDINKHLTMNLLRNGKYKFYAKQKIQELNLPFLAYNRINYEVKMDNKTIPSHINKNQLLTINNINKGKHNIQIIIHNNLADIIGYLLSISSIIIYLVLIEQVRKKHAKSNKK